MLRAALMVASLTLSLYATPYWIQVSSIAADKKIAPSLIKTIKKNGFSYKTVEEQGRKKVRLGSFSHYNEARKALPKIRCKIAYDAFIVPHASAKSTKKLPAVPTKVAPIVMKTEQEKPPVSVKAPKKSCECVYDVHLLRKTELDKALRYYKKSAYYGFDIP